MEFQNHSTSKQISKTYKKLNPIQHILLRPDTYVGSTSLTQQMRQIVVNQHIEQRVIHFPPGLYKIFDQILVNAADNYQRDPKGMTKIQVKITQKSVTISNDGKTIPVGIHQQHKIYAAQLIFGHLLTSSNFQDDIKKVTGGRNGYGAKLANIFSKKFIVQTKDSKNASCLKIQWKNNMKDMSQPIKTIFNGKDKTSIEFYPDFKKFGMKAESFTQDIICLFKKRVYDIAGILPKLTVSYNGTPIKINSFEQYVKLYYPQSSSQQLIYDTQSNNQRWQVIITPSDGQFQQVSFVNSIHTIKGGTHVNHVVDQIVRQLTQTLSKKSKDLQIKPFHIKNQMRVFINCQIQNPAFDSQTKQTLTTKQKDFGSQYKVSKNMMKAIQKSSIAERALANIRMKDTKKIDKELKKAKDRPLIPKLEDANLAGKVNGCVLILTQGDSAKALAMSGIQILGRDMYGVYPLKGKLLNVRDLTPKQALQNNQIKSLVRILGINPTKIYQNTQTLRYSSIMIMADQDNDGTHIKGLVINFFQAFWPGLVSIPGFLRIFITPIIRCTKGDQKIDFFCQNDYKNWKQNKISNQGKLQDGWKIKYYKGLGTSTSAQAKQYFSNLKKHQIQLNYHDQKDKQSIDLIFNKKNADLRKKWLQQSQPNVSLDYNNKLLKIQDFVNKQFINFSLADNIRSIPSIMDGLKPSQRKVLYGCFKRNLKNQIKVAQLAGYISQHTAYHHGQQSLNSTIISMAQNFVGSNNLNLLMPVGQFGTRFLLGKDAASARYIYTYLNPLTRYLFPQADDHIVQYLDEENQSIQPRFYYPILPLVLINGCIGIGTGWSTTIHPHKVDDVLKMIRQRLKKNFAPIIPGWQGFKGKVQIQKKGTYNVKGNFKYQEQSATVIINEIPINKSITDYKAFLESMLKTQDNPDPDLQQLRQYHIGDQIQFVTNFFQGKQIKYDQIEKFFKLSCTLQTTNMVLFNNQGITKKYQEISDILQQFFKMRLKGYTKRKQYLCSKYQREVQIINSKINFINRVIQGQFKFLAKKQDWIRQLKQTGFKMYNQFTIIKSTKLSDNLNTVTIIDKKQDQNINKINSFTQDKQYNYLLGMPIWTFCKQKVDELKQQKRKLQTILKHNQKINETQLWQQDLNQFQKAWTYYKQGRQMKQASQINNKRKRQMLNNQEDMSNNRNRNKRRVNKQNSNNVIVDINDSQQASYILKKTLKKIDGKSGNNNMSQYLHAKQIQKERGKSGQTKKKIISTRFSLMQEQKKLKQKNKIGDLSQQQQMKDQIQFQNIERNGKNGRKMIKTNFLNNIKDDIYNEQIQGDESMIMIEKSYKKKQKQQEENNNLIIPENNQQKNIDSLLAKYLKPSGQNSNLSFEQRIKARLNKFSNGGNNFTTAYVNSQGNADVQSKNIQAVQINKDQNDNKIKNKKKEEDIILNLDFLDDQ